MNATRKLVLVFKDSEGASKSATFNYAASEILKADVEALMDAIIANKEIFENSYTSKVRADVVVTNTDTIYPAE